MSEDFNAALKEFSDKHGAVLLGMHHELKATQNNIEESKLALENAQELSAKANLHLTSQQVDLQRTKDEISVEAKAWLDKVNAEVQARLLSTEKELIRLQTLAKQFDAKQAENAEIDKIRAANLSKKIDDYMQSQRIELVNELNKYKTMLDAKQLEVGKLHELCIALLTEHKQREIAHQQKVEQLKRTFNKLGLAVLIVLVVGAILFGVKLWMH